MKRAKEPGVEIVYEDRWLIVVEKDAGLLTMSTGKEGEVTAYSLVRGYAGGRIFIVHRLDRETSGLLVFAKDFQTKADLQDNWDEAVVRREYVALVQGCPPEQEGRVVSWLSDNPKSFKVTSCPYDNGGKKAITNYKLVEKGEKCSLISFELQTGRKNQIRVHSALMGCPVAGDSKYGASVNPLRRLCLHARSLVFYHPVTGKLLRFETRLPKGFKAF